MLSKIKKIKENYKFFQMLFHQDFHVIPEKITKLKINFSLHKKCRIQVKFPDNKHI